MNYRLSLQSATYPVEDIRIPAESILADQPVGQPFSFVAPVRVAVGQPCLLRGDSVGYQLMVNSCSGFTYSVRYLVSGTIATTAVAVAGIA
ncbi:MAG: hypothetical protein PCFJNLEI_03113 [Verrucomicrobiae bacterium]|nr:hypothetical protein [Verrucomicrobiae bacterium]